MPRETVVAGKYPVPEYMVLNVDLDRHMDLPNALRSPNRDIWREAVEFLIDPSHDGVLGYAFRMSGLEAENQEIYESMLSGAKEMFLRKPDTSNKYYEAIAASFGQAMRLGITGGALADSEYQNPFFHPDGPRIEFRNMESQPFAADMLVDAEEDALALWEAGMHGLLPYDPDHGVMIGATVLADYVTELLRRGKIEDVQHVLNALVKFEDKNLKDAAYYAAMRFVDRVVSYRDMLVSAGDYANPKNEWDSQKDHLATALDSVVDVFLHQEPFLHKVHVLEDVGAWIGGFSTIAHQKIADHMKDFEWEFLAALQQRYIEDTSRYNRGKIPESTYTQQMNVLAELLRDIPMHEEYLDSGKGELIFVLARYNSESVRRTAWESLAILDGKEANKTSENNRRFVRNQLLKALRAFPNQASEMLDVAYRMSLETALVVMKNVPELRNTVHIGETLVSVVRGADDKGMLSLAPGQHTERVNNIVSLVQSLNQKGEAVITLDQVSAIREILEKNEWEVAAFFY